MRITPLTATGSGGSIVITDSVITGNDAGITLTASGPAIPNSGGGIYAYLFSNDYPIPASLTISGTEISDNTAGQHGGGLAVCTKREDIDSATSRLSVYNTTIFR